MSSLDTFLLFKLLAMPLKGHFSDKETYLLKILTERMTVK
jgi:hypothetical protein